MNEEFESVLHQNVTSFFEGLNVFQARKKYRRYARILHPDMVDASQRDLASEAFDHLSKLWDAYNNRASSFGKGSTRTTGSNSSTVKTKKHEYVLDFSTRRATVVSVIDATYDAGHERAKILTSLSPLDNDIITNAASSLKKLNNDVEPRYQAFFPQMLEKFSIAQADGNHAAIAIKRQYDGFFSLAEVKEKYPQGLHGRDIGWIFRRLLVAVGKTNEQELIHAGVTLNSVYVNPVEHGLILEDWHYSVPVGEKLLTYDAKYKDFYPSYALQKQPMQASMDVRMAARTMREMMAPSAPKQMRAFLKGCEMDSNADAPGIIHEFTQLLEQLYGPPKWHTFTM